MIEVRMMIDLLPNNVMMGNRDNAIELLGEEGFVLATLETAANITLGLSYQKLQDDLVAKQNRFMQKKNEKAESSLKVELDGKLIDYYR